MQNRTSTMIWRTRWPMIALAFFGLAAIFIPHRVWNTLFFGMLGLFGISYFWVKRVGEALSAERRLRFGWVSVGDRLREDFVIVNDSWLPALAIEVEDDSNVPGYTARVVQAVNGADFIRWHKTAVCLNRGQYRLGPWRMRLSDPFGLFEMVHAYNSAEEIVIHPPIHTQIPVRLPTGRASGRARARDRAIQATINASAVRDYRPGDPERWIHWPTSARRDQLFVRQFDLDAAGDIWILLDMQRSMQFLQGLDGTEEHAILLAASLAMQALRENRPVGVAAFGQDPQIVIPAGGEGQQWRILRTLALLEADGDASLRVALREMRVRIRQGSGLVLFTADLTGDWVPDVAALIGRGVQVTVGIFDGHTFGNPQSAVPIADLVRRVGADVLILRQGDIGKAPEQARRGHDEFRVTPFGRAQIVRRAD